MTSVRRCAFLGFLCLGVAFPRDVFLQRLRGLSSVPQIAPRALGSRETTQCHIICGPSCFAQVLSLSGEEVGLTPCHHPEGCHLMVIGRIDIGTHEGAIFMWMKR